MFSQSEAHAHNTAARTQLTMEECTQLGASLPPSGEDTPYRGGLSSVHCWTYSGDKLQVFSKEDGCLLALYTPLHASDTIRHVVEYEMTSEADLPHKHLFLISTSRSPRGPHFLLVFNPEVSRVIKAIQLSFPALAICPLYSGPCPEEGSEWPLCEVSCGLVAVGGGCGLVVLLDLRLDDEEEIFGENTPSENTTYNSDQITELAVLQQVRRECIADLSHPSYILPGMRLPIERNFVFRSRDSEENRTYPSCDVFVSCLTHIPSLSVLVVGYNLGFFQLYDVTSLELLFSSDADNLPSPVLEVLYQEPEDDPRDSVYLWVVRGRAHSPEETAPSHSLLCLYQLQFRYSRSLYRQQGDLRLLERSYSRFLDGGLKLSHFLSPSPYSKQIALSKSTRVVSSGVFLQHKRVQEQWSPDTPSGPLSPSQVSHTRDLTLCYFVYRTSQQPHGGYRLALFDLNIWYNSQLQASISPTSKFYHVYDLDSLLPLLSSRRPASPLDFSILDLKLTSLQRFDLTPPIPEPFLLPFSLSIRFQALLPSCLPSCWLPGEQERVLALTADTLSAGYLDNIESVCLDLSRSGLAPSPPLSPSPVSQLESWEESVLLLLNVSLEQGRLDPVHNCVLNSQHMAGEIPLSLISRWALSKFEELRDSLLTQSSSLLAEHPNPRLSSSIKSLLCRFRYLSALLSRIPTAHLSTHLASEPHTPHIYERSIEILSLYHEALLWLTSLPPQLLGSYRYSSMLSHYRELRQYHQSPLIVDQLLSQLNTALFQQWVGAPPDRTGTYPPPSPLAALDPLLDPSLPEASQALLLYFLIDLGMQSEEQPPQPLTTSFISNCAQVPKRLPSLSYSFWLIDNGHFRSGLVELLGVPSSMLQLFPFAIPSTIEFLLSSEHSCHLVSLLLSVHRPVLDTLTLFQLYLQALVKSGNLFDAIKQLYNFFPIGSTHECLSDLLSSCDLPALKRLVHTPMEPMVLSQVAEFLQNKDTFLHSEILIMLLLKQNRVPQGVQTYRRIKAAMLSQARNEKEKARLSLLDQLVQAFAKTAACDLEFASRPPTEHRAPKREVSMPTPLSTKIRRHQLSSVASQKLLLSSLNDKVAELQQAKFQFEEMSSPSQLPPREPTRHRYKRLSELTYPSPTELPALSGQATPALHRATPLKQAMDRYMNKSFPARSSLPPVSLVRLSQPPLSPPLSPFAAFSHLIQPTPSSILKQPVHRDSQLLTPLNLDFSSQGDELPRQRRTRFDVPLSSAPDNTQPGSETREQNGDEDIPYHSPLSTPRECPLPLPPVSPEESPLPLPPVSPEESPPPEHPYYSPPQIPDPDQQSAPPPEDIPGTPGPPDTPSMFQTEPVTPPPSLPEEVLKMDPDVLTIQLADRNSEHTEPDNRDPNESALSDSPDAEGLPAPALEHSFEPEQLCRTPVSANSLKEDVTHQHLNLPDLVKIIPEIEGIDKRTGSELRKHFSPRTDTYPLIKYTPFSVDDEKNKIFASLQLGESPFKIASSSLSTSHSHKESFLHLRSVETTTASYIISEPPAPLESTPLARISNRHKSFRSTSASADTDTPHRDRVPQHHYFTRAKAPSTPDVEVRNSPINFLHTVPVEKQNKPPKVTLFNKSGSLRRSQRLKDRSSN